MALLLCSCRGCRAPSCTAQLCIGLLPILFLLTLANSQSSISSLTGASVFRKLTALRSTSCDACEQEIQGLRKWYEGYKASRVQLPHATGVSLLQAASDDVADLKVTLKAKQEELARIQTEYQSLKAEFSAVNEQKAILDGKLIASQMDWAGKALSPEAMQKARELLDECGKSGPGLILSSKDLNLPIWKGYACEATDEELARYFDYEARKLCPDDWLFVQDLIYVKNCFALPKRRCLARTPPSFVEPMPFPKSLFSQSALIDDNVRWTNHWCKSFHCLNTRKLGDCRNCFNMSLEFNRWKESYRGSITMADVIALKKGALRIGLDAGGGTGSFAAHAALYNVTVMTTAMNIETVVGRKQGLPYMETIALRVLIPLHVPHKARLPLFDNTLDLIHCVNSIKYLPILEFEELLFEWDRVLRVGGVLWFEMFYAPVEEMPIYVAMIEKLGYKKLHWNVTPKPDMGERKGAHVYLNCVIEKTVRSD